MNEKEEKQKIEAVLARLAHSRFRSRFHLHDKERQYVLAKGLPVIQQHAEDFLAQRIAPAYPQNDGKQTPMRNHPVFIAQHATACCCRGCIEKWHHIPQGKALNQMEIQYLRDLIMTWIIREMG